MNKQNILILPLVLASLIAFILCGCNNNRNSISITTKDNNKYYQFKARFNQRKSEQIKQCLNKNLMQYSDISLDKNYINETIVLNNDTKFYLQTAPGKIKVEFNKYENSEASYNQIKKLCDDIKQQIQSN